MPAKASRKVALPLGALGKSKVIVHVPELGGCWKYQSFLKSLLPIRKFVPLGNSSV